MLHAVIMAGGSGTRFWPASTASRPKQLLDLVGGQTMIQATVRRLGQAIPPERVLVVTNERLVAPIREQVPEMPAASVIGEPCKRDTAPCIGLAAIQLAQVDPDATMIVMPADHIIATDEHFQQAMLYAAELVESQPGRIVTFGVRPSYPAEIFGYIERVEADKLADDPPTYRVAQFREKPNAETAQQFLDAGTFYWNAGIFVWKARTIMEQLAEHEQEMFGHLETIAKAAGTSQYEEVLREEFPKIDGKSIDYAVMERATDVVVVEAPFKWDDVGTWQSLPRLRGVDEKGNTIAGTHLGIDTTGSIIRTKEGHLVVTVGVNDCIVVQTEKATLVANRHDEEKIRQVVEQLKEKGWDEYL